MDGSSAQALPALTESTIAAFFSHNENPFIETVSEDCTFISSQGAMLRGVDALQSIIKAHRKAPAMMIRETDFHLVSAPEQDCLGAMAIVSGAYKIYTSPREQLLYASTQLVTACYRLTERGWRIFHMHTSDRHSEPVSNDLFPIEISRETYDYVREILRTGSRAGILPSRVMLDGTDTSHYVSPDNILFVEAEGKRSVIHCIDGDFPVSSLISEVIPQLPGTFLRVHRSYLVNTAHIVGIRKYVLQLSDGSEIPIPERRYTEVRRDIALRAAGGMR